MLACFVNPTLTHFFGGTMKLASSVVFKVGQDGRLTPDPLDDDLSHAAAIPALFHFVDSGDEQNMATGDATNSEADDNADLDVRDEHSAEEIDNAPPLTPDETAAARAVMSRVLAAKAPRKSKAKKGE